ncbi:MAG: putative kinase, aminoglycoside phosphotransferase family, partial [Ilumatobacteraceae bacterium]|nr:putative kinase, aminoglycoside phosphotransferase family [Ilumatobacteraceae bacterium]
GDGDGDGDGQTAPVTGPVDQPAAEVVITAPLVRALLTDQHPDLADRPLVELAHGWDNVAFRLGHDLIVRLPRRALAAPLVLHEQRWLPDLAPTLPLPVPAPLRIGQPNADYPWTWSIVPWFEGRSALTDPPADPVAAARSLGAFLRALHRPAPADAPPNPYRGIPLAGRDELTNQWIDQLPDHIDSPQVRACWGAHVALPRWDAPPVWLHGDLHPHNVVVHEGAVAAIIDFGDITSGDPATDLGIAWMLLPAAARPVLRDAAGADDATWARGRGWALALGLAYLANSASTPGFARLGRRTIDAVLADHWAV